jgi:hypothetical protein
MKIEIEINEIEGYCNYSVKAGDKSTSQLTFDEALGLVAVLLMPKNRIPCLQWLKTKEAHEEQAGKWLKKDLEVEFENSITPNWVDDKANVQFKTNKLN